MSTKTPDQMFDSLTGFDEIAIAAHFGDSITALASRAQPDAPSLDPFPFLRALAFVDLRRGGKTDKEAYEAAMTLSIAQAQTYFVDDEDPDDAGKEPSA